MYRIISLVGARLARESVGTGSIEGNGSGAFAGKPCAYRGNHQAKKNGAPTKRTEKP
jgi:hypothetical protein